MKAQNTKSQRPRIGPDEQFALLVLAKRGRAGAAAREIANGEGAGLRIGAALVRHGLAEVTRDNRFMLARYAGKSVPKVIRWDDGRDVCDDGCGDGKRKRIGRIE
jgi:hypothetical protein